MVAVLGRIFGFGRLEMIEDAVQDALVAALRRWPFSGSPANPRAWLIEAAKNRVLDRLRRESRFEAPPPEEDTPAASINDDLLFEKEIGEDQLRMIFACCHPAISPDSRVALTLKAVGGFSVREIARAFLSNDEAVAKMLTRAKQRLIAEGVQLEMPPPAELPGRLDAALRVIYLMFNEGYGASAGDDLIRADLCFEAIRLAEFLARHPATASPKVHAAAALFLFQAARLPARVGDTGELIVLADQDRSRWSSDLIARGLRHFRASAAGSEITSYHLEAEIAALYTLAPTLAETDWHRILECYDALQRRSYSPVAELNRIIVIGQIHGPERAITELSSLAVTGDIAKYNLFHITRAHFLESRGDVTGASEALRTALEMTENQAVRRFISSRLDALQPVTPV